MERWPMPPWVGQNCWPEVGQINWPLTADQTRGEQPMAGDVEAVTTNDPLMDRTLNHAL